MQNRLFWSTAHDQDCFILAIYVKLSPGLYSTWTVSNTIPGADPGGPWGPRPPTTKNEAPAPKFYKIEAPEWQF